MKYMSKAILLISKLTNPKQMLFKQPLLWRGVHAQQLGTFQVAAICCFLFIMSTCVVVCGTLLSFSFFSLKICCFNVCWNCCFYMLQTGLSVCVCVCVCEWVSEWVSVSQHWGCHELVYSQCWVAAGRASGVKHVPNQLCGSHRCGESASDKKGISRKRERYSANWTVSENFIVTLCKKL